MELTFKLSQIDIIFHWLAYARIHAAGVVSGCYGVLNNEIRSKLAKNRLNFTVFALDPRGACTHFAPLEAQDIISEKKNFT